MCRPEQLLLPTDLQVLYCSLMETLLKRLKHRKPNQSLSCSLDMQVTNSLSHTDLISIYFLMYMTQRLVYTAKHWQIQLHQQPPLLETICRKCFGVQLRLGFKILDCKVENPNRLKLCANGTITLISLKDSFTVVTKVMK